MADMIEGTSGHAHFAPLSHAQTIAISRHLQDQIRALQQGFDEVQRSLMDTNATVTGLHDNSAKSGGTIQQLRDALAATNAIVESNCKDLKRANSNISKLQSGLDEANDSLGALKDAQKVTNTMLQKVDQEHNQTVGQANMLQEAIERRIDLELAALRDGQSKMNLDLKHLKADEDALKEALRVEREALRDTNLEAKNLSDHVTEGDTKMKILEGRLAETAQKQKASTQNLGDLNAATLKLHEDHEHTKATTAELAASLKKAHANVKHVRDCQDKASTSLGTTQAKLDEHSTVLDNVRQNLDQANGKVQTLKEGFERSSNMIHYLGEKLAEVNSTTQAVKAGLKEQSSLLLPNIHLDSQEARAATARHGSILATTGLVSPRKTSSRTGNHNGAYNQTQRNTCSPNKMAWT